MAMSREYTDPGKLRIVSDRIIEELKKRFSGFAAPDGEFNPSTAAPDVLRKYGLPPKPDPERQPRLREVWDAGFGRPIHLQKFEFDEGVVDFLKTIPYRLLARHADEMPLAETRFETSGNWSGAYITANQDKRFLQIWGVWKIPGNLQLPPAPLQGPSSGLPYLCANWIGLDGQRLYVDSSLPQIGTTSTLQADASTAASAWIQWWARGNADDQPPMPIALTLNPGDEVLCVLTAWDPRTVVGVLVNLDTKPLPTAMAVGVTAPTATLPDGRTIIPEIAGATAEWIVERPRKWGETTRYNFPKYGETRFRY